MWEEKREISGRQPVGNPRGRSRGIFVEEVVRGTSRGRGRGRGIPFMGDVDDAAVVETGVVREKDEEGATSGGATEEERYEDDELDQGAARAGDMVVEEEVLTQRERKMVRVTKRYVVQEKVDVVLSERRAEEVAGPSGIQSSQSSQPIRKRRMGVGEASGSDRKKFEVENRAKKLKKVDEKAVVAVARRPVALPRTRTTRRGDEVVESNSVLGTVIRAVATVEWQYARRIRAFAGRKEDRRELCLWWYFIGNREPPSVLRIAELEQQYNGMRNAYLLSATDGGNPDDMYDPADILSISVDEDIKW